MNTVQEKIEALTRPNIRSLKPYSSARDEAPEGILAQRIMLDANENSYGGPLEEDFSRYPDPQQRVLKQALAKLKNVQENQIFIGNGSDEAIDLLFRAFVQPGQDNVILLPPTYGMYAVQGNIHDAEIRQAPLRPDFLPDPEAIWRQTDQHSKLLFICSPNNPTGQRMPDELVLELLHKFPGLVVLDEAYLEFSAHASWAARISEFSNLVVLQTLSKAWGLAGLRVGMALSNPFVINTLNKIKYPYNLNAKTIQLGLKALERPDKMHAKAAQIVAERQRLALALVELEAVETVFPSDANFLLVRVKDADGLYQFMAQKGIVVRNRSREIHCENCLRITIGTAAENDQVLAVIQEFTNETTIILP